MLSPEELVRTAAGRGVRTLAITDHDTTGAFGSALKEAAAAQGVRVIAGIETSASVGTDDVHLLGLGIDPESAELQQLIRAMRSRRQERAKAILDRLGALGVGVDWESVEAQAGGVVTRPHLASALVDGGHVPDIRSAFDLYLARGAGAFVRLQAPSAEEWIAAIRAAGGVSVLAHPGHWTPHRTVLALMEQGLDAVEVRHPSHDVDLEVYYQDLADREGLMCGGGSDFHGRFEEEAERLGQFQPPPPRLERLMDPVQIWA